MEMLSLIAALFVAVSFLLAPCASSDHLYMEEKCMCYADYGHITQPLLPRKLKLHDEATVKALADKDFMQHKMMTGASILDNKQHERDLSETHAEQEGTSNAEYFTMDYRPVRRRRPIHNKHNPNFDPLND